MTSRRTGAATGDVGADYASRGSVSTTEKSDIAPAVPASVIYKLLGFTFAMITLPISTYFFTLDNVFRGNSTFAGGAAAIMANIVLVSYVVAAMLEDKSERETAEEKQKKSE